MMTDQEMLEHATFVSNKGGLELEKLAGAASCKGKEMLMVLDGASTVAVVQDESKCIDIEDVNKYIKTGGQGKPTLVHCKRQGVLPIDMIVDGKRLQVRLPARIIPGFGVDVLPECFFLKKNFSINKKGPSCEILTPKGETALRASALRHDDSWLFYVQVEVANTVDTTLATSTQKQQPQQHPPYQQLQRNGLESTHLKSIVNHHEISNKSLPPKACTTKGKDSIIPIYNINYPSTYRDILDLPVDLAYAYFMEEGEVESLALLPLQDQIDSCYSSRISTDVVKQLQAWHLRLGHLNFKDVADLMLVKLPPNMPPCLSCVKGKSRRRPLTGGGEAIHDGIRPGYAWAWDHAGPFPLKTWGGNNIFSLKIDIFTGKLAPRMTNTTGGCYEEWSEHVTRLESHFGRQVVARLITDSAPYFEEARLDRFNNGKGIVHVRAPPYTQELNALAERTLGTLLAMARTSLDYCGAPERAFGECLMAMCETLDRRKHKRGGRLTRLEKWHGRLLPKQHDKLKAWGCAAYLHLDYGKRGTIGKLGKLDPRAELFLFVGYDPNGMGYRIATLPGFAIRTALHITFVEDFFPCRSTVPKQVQSFMTPDQQERAVDRTTPVEDKEQRPRRAWHPSAEALEQLAAGDASPPDVIEFAKELEIPYLYYLDTVFTTTESCPRSVPAALAGPEAESWRDALNTEATQHAKNGTFGPAIEPKNLPPGVKPIPFDCVLDIKRDGRKKIRGIMKGFRMTQGLDYNETFAPVPCIAILRFLLAVSAKLDWEIKQGDVHTAFLGSDMDTLLIAAVPNWFKVGASGSEHGYTLRQVLKGVPGIPQGSKLFYKKVRGIFTGPNVGLVQCKSEFCLYFCVKRNLYLIVWVDDLFFFFPSHAKKEALKVWQELQKKLELDDWQDIDDCLACVVRRDRANRTLTLSQQPAIEKLLLRNNMQDANRKETPMTAGLKLSKKQCPTAEQAAVMTSEQLWYRSVVASTIYFVAWTRVDLAYSVSKLCKFMQNPGREHIIALKRLLRYLACKKDFGLKFDFNAGSQGTKTGVYGYYDAAHADCPDTMRSTMAHVFLFFGCPLSWKTKLHSFVTTSTNHSEYCAAAKAAREAKWWETTLTAIGFGRFVGPIDLFSDSKGAIAMTYNPVQRAASKHVDLADHYAREQQERGTITISHVGTKDMLADILTKALPLDDFARHAAQLVHQVRL